jgi:hypothetical protein
MKTNDKYKETGLLISSITASCQKWSEISTIQLYLIVLQTVKGYGFCISGHIQNTLYAEYSAVLFVAIIMLNTFLHIQNLY